MTNFIHNCLFFLFFWLEPKEPKIQEKVIPQPGTFSGSRTFLIKHTEILMLFSLNNYKAIFARHQINAPPAASDGFLYKTRF